MKLSPAHLSEQNFRLAIWNGESVTVKRDSQCVHVRVTVGMRELYHRNNGGLTGLADRLAWLDKALDGGSLNA